jgi:hypothetical protein
MKKAFLLLAATTLIAGCGDSNRTGEGAMGGPGSESSTRLGQGGSPSKSNPTANSGLQQAITNKGSLGSASAPDKYSRRPEPNAASTSGAPLTTTGPRLEPGGKESNPDR